LFVLAFFFSVGGDRFELTYYIAGGATMLAGLILLPTICLKTPVYVTKQSNSTKHREKLFYATM